MRSRVYGHRAAVRCAQANDWLPGDRRRRLAGLVGAQSVGATTSPTSGPLTPALARHLSQNANQHVIVILKRQFAAAHVGSRAASLRSHAVDGVQSPLLRELRAVHATHIKSFQLVDAFAATVSKGEVARLRANPAVAEVIPDVTIHGPAPAQVPTNASHKLKSHQSTTLTPNVIPGACGPNRQVQLDPEGLSLDQHGLRQPTPADRAVAGDHGRRREGRLDRRRHRPEQRQLHPAQRHLGVQRLPRLQRQRPRRATSGGEAFLDANTIAGQGIHVYNVNGFSAQPDPTACNIRIEGVAPGASLVGLNVFSSTRRTPRSRTSCRRSTTRSRSTTST